MSRNCHCDFKDARFWDKMLQDKGWKRVYLQGKMTYGEFAELTRNLEHPIAASSFGHVASIFKGKVNDIWNSEKCIIDYVVVHPLDLNELKKQLKKG